MKGENWIVVATGDREIQGRIKQVFDGARLRNPVFYVADGGELSSYLAGTGSYGMRSSFPMPKMLIIDASLPGRNGLDILKLLRADAIHHAVPVIVLVDKGQEHIIDQAFDAGATTFLPRDFSFPEFLERSRLLNSKWLITRPVD